MPKTVDFYLGPVYAALATRQLTITPMPKAGDDTFPSATHNADAGAGNETVSVSLADNETYQAKLVDTLDGGEVLEPVTIQFCTEELLNPGPVGDSGLALFRVLAMEDESSSSSNSSSSQSSSSSSSDSSSSSLNSSSSSSSSDSSSDSSST